MKLIKNANRADSLQEYERKQAEIRKLLRQIEVGLEKHDHQASGPGGHHWGFVGDLEHVTKTLADIKDFLHGTGEYAKGG